MPLIDGVGFGFLIVDTLVDPVQPLPSVTVTENDPAVFTEIVCDVSSVDHKYPA